MTTFPVSVGLLLADLDVVFNGHISDIDAVLEMFIKILIKCLAALRMNTLVSDTNDKQWNIARTSNLQSSLKYWKLTKLLRFT